MITENTLSCGHTIADGEGVAITPDNLRICYACSYARELEALKTADTYMAYLHVPTDDQQNTAAHAALGRIPATLTTWPGQVLARVTSLRKTRHNIGGYIYRFNAIDVHGAAWYGTSPGPSMYARMRRSKSARRR